MRNLFRGYYKPTPAEFTQIWKHCIFSFDTNVLLHIYSYTPATRERFFEILNGFSDRIWIPHQVAYEYQKNRPHVIYAQQKAYGDIEGILNQGFYALRNDLLKSYRRHPFIDTQQILADVEKAMEEIKSKIQFAQLHHPNYMDYDELREILSDLFDGKVGQPYSDEELEIIYQKAEKRFTYKQPPGYKDAKKTIPRSYGDVVLWFQLIDYAKSQQKPVLFVTDDNKEDWWLKVAGETFAPRPDLIQEILSEVGREDFQFYMYHSDEFIEQAEKFLNLPVRPEAIQEAREIMLQESVIQRADVKSTYLRTVGYDVLSQILEIEFRTGEVFQYLNVPPTVYTDLMNAPSLGQYFNENIRDVYSSRKL
ncbi:MAG: PIN domain-containing protein [Coleofasciculus sp. S288]|nr:PIN domain-containing protein [Coleofasciculus sp. S288]